MGARVALMCHRIRVTDEAISEIVGNVALVSIPRRDVRKLRIQRGIVAERPLVLALFGLCGIVVGGFALLYLLRTTFSPSYRGEVLPLKITVGLLIFLFIGPAALYFAFRRGMVMFVDTEGSTRKLGFGAKLSPEHLAAFVDKAREIGLDVEVHADLPVARAARSAGEPG